MHNTAAARVLPQHMAAPQQSEFCNYGTITLCFFVLIHMKLIKSTAIPLKVT